MDLEVENDALLEMNQMALRSGRNLVKCAADSAELAAVAFISAEESPGRKSSQRKMNKRKSKLEEENEVAETSPLVENSQTPNSKLSQMKKRRKSTKTVHEQPGTSTTSKENIQTPVRKSVRIKRSIGKEKENEDPAIACISAEESPDRKSNQIKRNKRKSKLEEENEMAETSPLVENSQTPNSILSQIKKRRKSIQIVHEQPGTSTTSKENTQTPVRKSVHIQRSVGKEKENEEPAVTCILAEESSAGKSSRVKLNRRKSIWDEENVVATACASVEDSSDRKSSGIKLNRRKSKRQEENEESSTSTTSKENTQTPVRKSVHMQRSVGKEKENEEPAVACISAEESPDRKSNQGKSNKRKSKLEEENEMAETSPLAQNSQTPNSMLSQMKKRRKSIEIVHEQPAIACIIAEESPAGKSSQAKLNRRKSIWDEENVVATACTSVEGSSDRKSSETKLNRKKSKRQEENKESEFSDLVLSSQVCEISSTHVIENVERNVELSAHNSDQNEEDIAEILNSTFEVNEENSILQTPARKRSVRFADSVETRRQTASFPSSVDNSPKFSTPVSVNSKQRSSQHKGTPHPSAKKRPASILKTSSSKKFPSSTSLRGKGSARKMPDFSSIHKAQFEKMESIVDFSQRRHKCVRKLDAQVVDDDDNDKQAQLKPSAVVKPIKQTGNALSRIPVVSRNTSRPGTPRALSSSHIPAASFHVLKEKNFDARHNVPHAVNSRPSFTKMGNNSRPTPVSNTKPQRITYEQAKTIIQSKKPLAAVKRETERLENRNILKGVRLNRRFELQMQHRKINM